MPTLSLNEIETLASAALIACGATPAAAGPVARSIRRAEADGIGPVGLGYLPTYLRHLRGGRVDGTAKPHVTRVRPGAVTADARHGFAHPAFDLALPALVAATREAGTATLAINHSYSIGVIGHPVEDLASEGLVALAFTNSPPNVPPWGGSRPLYGTNPLALAAPRSGRPPLVIDLATSQVAKVTLTAALEAGGPLPSGWAFDAEGQPTTDPAAAAKGSMAPLGGPKGAALALIVEILSAALTGAAFSKDALAYRVAEGAPPNIGQSFVAFDPSAFAPGFLDRIDDIATAVTSQDGARLPGDRRLTARSEAERNGVEVDAALLAAIEKAHAA